ncbi:MAG: phosphoenolpyruvate--protein phosphotransferase [Kiritimatiellia bacterium]
MCAQRIEDHFTLLADIGAISSILSESSDLQGFLDRAVVMVAAHLDAEVCSIYLYEDQTKRLVLRSTHGLRADAVGQISLAVGDGLVGKVMKELRPICVERASEHPDFHYFPALGEEPFESFLGVPILRGTEKIGVLAVQRRDRYRFRNAEVQAMRALTAQLAAAIETARTLLQIASLQVAVDVGEKPREQATLVKGRMASPGYALGPAVHFVRKPAASILAQYRDEESGVGDAKALDAALGGTADELREMQQALEKKLPEVAALIFEAHMMMLKDRMFTDSMYEAIEAGSPATKAVSLAAFKYMKVFAASKHEYVREKADDIADLALRVLRHLDGRTDRGRQDWHGGVVLASELLPSDILMITLGDVAGIVLCGGGVTSHISIVVRALSIPMIVTDSALLDDVADGVPVLLDADGGNAYVNPGSDILAKFKEREALRKKAEQSRALMLERTETKDGTRVTLLANINLLSELKLALDLCAEGVGLYRTEFPFLVRASLPTEEEQFMVYSKLLQQMDKRVVYLRTLDAGGDKMLPYLEMPPEPNPALGLRSTRLTLLHRDILHPQVRAILRAGVDTPGMHIMFPMICSLDEFRQARDAVHKMARDLSDEYDRPFEVPRVGMMVELPSTVELADAFAAEADFFSIGTNDFIQYMLAVDRNNTSVMDYYCPHHPAVLRGLARIAAAAAKAGIPCSVCGEMAHDTRYVPFFIGIGIRQLSVDPHYLPEVQQCIVNRSIKEMRAYADALLQESSIIGVEKVMQGYVGSLAHESH